MKLTIVVPAFNEEATLCELLDKVVGAEIPEELQPWEIVIVDDCSGDRTREKAEAFAERCESVPIRVFGHERNQGKGAALATAIGHAKGDFILIQDADLEYSPDDYPKLLKPIAEGRADVVYGSRFLGEEHRVLYFWHSVGNMALTLFSNALTNINLSDMETCYKVFPREPIAAVGLKSKRFGVEPELTARFAQLGLRIFEVGISYSGRTYAEGKKIGWKDGLSAIYHIVWFNFFDRVKPE